MFLKDKFSSPVLKLLRSDNIEFILSFFYYVFRNEDKQVEIIRQTKIEKELKEFIKNYNFEKDEDKNEENSKIYIEFWIKSNFFRRLEINEFGDDFDIELSEPSLQVMNFIDNLGIEDDLLYASVKSNFENAMTNLKSIAFSSKAFKKQNIAEIDKQIIELEKKKKLIKAGDLKVFEDEVYDKYNSAKELLKKLPVEFRKVETVFENIYRNIQQKSNEIDINRGKILSFTLDEIEEKINNSPQGKSFEGFEKFYRQKPKELIEALEKVFDNYEKIQKLENQKSIKSILNIDILKSKKRAYNKKTFLVSKLREIFNEENQKERKKGVYIIKEIKKISSLHQNKIDYKKTIFELKNGFLIDLFIGKHFWEPQNQLKFEKYEVEKKEEDKLDALSIENLFRYTTPSETQIKNNIDSLLEKQKEALLEEVLNEYPIEYGVDEFLTYLKIAIYNGHEISKNKNSEFEIEGIHNKLRIESSKIKFIK